VSSWGAVPASNSPRTRTRTTCTTSTASIVNGGG
jgi:hypothetical protein